MEDAEQFGYEFEKGRRKVQEEKKETSKKTDSKIKGFFIKNQILLKSLLTITLFFFNSLFEFIPALIFDIDYDKTSNKAQILLSFYDYIILLLVLYLLYRKDIKRYFKDLKQNFGKIIDRGFSYWTIGLIIMMLSNFLIMKFVPQATPTNEIEVQKIIKTLPMISFLSIGILGPIIEEFTFRKTFYDLIKNKDVFVIVSGGVFGVLHVLFSFTSYLDFLYVIPYSALGICLAMMYKKTDNLFTSILMHIFHNSILTIIAIASLGL